MSRFSSLGVIESIEARPKEDIDMLFNQLNSVFAKQEFTKSEIVEVMQEFLPNFEHEEKGKNLDQKM